MLGRYQATSSFLCEKYVGKDDFHQEQGLQNFMTFAYYSSSILRNQTPLTIQAQHSEQLNHICSKLLSDGSPIDSSKLSILAGVANNMNEKRDYREMLESLIDRDYKKLGKEGNIANKQLLPNVHPELELLYHMGLTLNNRHCCVGEKSHSNERINQILQKYEGNRADQVYKPLTALVMSLIGERHYMSGEGMIGHIKGGESGLFKQGSDVLQDSQDHRLVENIYRMLVTRANHQSFQSAWSKQDPLRLGVLVAQRILSAPLYGHSLHNLII